MVATEVKLPAEEGVEVPAAGGVSAMLESRFKIAERGSSVLTEFRAGTATFLTMVYIVIVNASILADSGGPCPDNRTAMNDGVEVKCDDPDAGFNFFYDPTGCYMECVGDTKKALITTTAVSSFLACVLMGVLANLPFALAPGMGMNAYFTYTVVGFMGANNKNIPWKTAMTAVFIEGLIFIFLAVTGLRLKFAKAIPACIKTASTAGIGLFLAHLGLQTAEGIGMVVADGATSVTLGGCPPEYRHPMLWCSNRTDYTNGWCLASGAYTCDIDPGFPKGNQGGGIMTSATTWIGIFGVYIISILLVKKVRAAMVIGIAFVTVISWFKNTDVSYFEDDVMPGGADRFEYFKKIVNVEPIGIIAGQIDFKGFGKPELWNALFTFLYIDLLDTTSTFFAMAKYADLADPKGNFPGQDVAMVVDGVATTVGALMGTSPVTTYIESAAGIEDGGRTGLTAIVCGIWFFLTIFFAPILASVPPWGMGPALIIVGAMMMRSTLRINWLDYAEAIPSFACIVLMPLTYSIANGIIAGLFTYACINIPVYAFDVYKGEATWPSAYVKELMGAEEEDIAVDEAANVKAHL